MKVVIFTADSNGGYPVPAVRGGAISTLVEHLVKENEDKQLIDLTIVSLYDREAKEKAEDYPHINFVWIKTPRIVKGIDKLAYFCIRKVFRKKKTLSYISMLELINYIFRASRYLKKNKYDKAVIENNVPMAWIIRLSKYKGDYYYHFHNIPRINAGCKKVFDNAAGFLCVSDYVANRIQKNDNPIGPVALSKTMTLYNCVDTLLFRKIEDEKLLDKERKKLHISGNKKIVVYVGRLSEEKGIDKLLEAIPLVKTQNIKVLIVGSLIYNQSAVDMYQLKLKELAEKSKDKVIFTGYIDQKELPLIYNLADVTVLPSMWDEPAGLTMVEAMACGTPVITTKSGGIPEYVGEYGVVLERDERLVANIAKSVDRVICENLSFTTLAEEGMNRVKKFFSPAMYIQNFANCINETSFGNN